MPLMPKRVKFRKAQRGRVKGNATRGTTVEFGEYALQALAPAWLSARQIEAGRVAAVHHMGPEGKLWIRVFPDKPVSSRPAETRMGKGKGEVTSWVAPVKPGRVLFEVGGVSEEVARQTLARVAHKMPMRVRFLHRRQVV